MTSCTFTSLHENVANSAGFRPERGTEQGQGAYTADLLELAFQRMFQKSAGYNLVFGVSYNHQSITGTCNSLSQSYSFLILTIYDLKGREGANMRGREREAEKERSEEGSLLHWFTSQMSVRAGAGSDQNLELRIQSGSLA